MASPTSPLTSPNTHPTTAQQSSAGLPNSDAAQPNSLGAQGARPRGERIEGHVQTLIMLLIGVAAGAASFRHVHDVAAAHGQTGWLAWFDAVTLELASIAAGLDLRRRKRLGKPVAFPAMVLTCAVALSLAAQVVEAEASVIGWIAAALPALGFLAMVKMAMARADTSTPNAVRDATATPTDGSWTLPDKQPLVPDEAGPDPDTTGLVLDSTDEAGTGRDRRGLSPDVTALVPAARQAAASRAAQGTALNRTSLAAQLRKEGHHLSTATATTLARLLRTEATQDLSAPAKDAT